jgi:hypothetical protein
MEEHWSTVRFVLDVLTRKVSGMDNDGFSVQFTEGTGSFKNSGRASNKKTLDDMLSSRQVRSLPGTTTNIARSLRKVLSPYLEEVQRSKGRVSDLTLIVLTNGLWEGSTASSDIEHVVVDFATKLLRFERTRLDQSKRMSLEFIWFGGDQVVAERMKALDSELNPRGLP